eukprot:7535828-Pyramimonas_sp.AAC.1
MLPPIGQSPPRWLPLQRGDSTGRQTEDSSLGDPSLPDGAVRPDGAYPEMCRTPPANIPRRLVCRALRREGGAMRST